MVRRQTLIMLVVFVALVGLVFYLQENPLPNAASMTPSPTAPVQMLPGLTSGEISGIRLNKSQGAQVTIAREAPGAWHLVSEEAKPADAGKAEQLCAQIASAQVMTFLPQDTATDMLGLTDPAYTLQVSTVGNQQNEILIGKRIPTGNGYYAQVNDQAPIVINQHNVDTIVSLMNDLLVSEEPTEEPVAPAP